MRREVAIEKFASRKETSKAVQYNNRHLLCSPLYYLWQWFCDQITISMANIICNDIGALCLKLASSSLASCSTIQLPRLSYNSELWKQVRKWISKFYASEKNQICRWTIFLSRGRCTKKKQQALHDYSIVFPSNAIALLHFVCKLNRRQWTAKSVSTM